MTENEALHHARVFLRSWVDVRPCDIPHDGLYGFDEESEYLFEVVLDGPLTAIGESNYIAVSKKTGNARYAGDSGE